MTRKRGGSPLGGIILVLLGLLFLADTLGFHDVNFGDLFRTWWPMIFVAVGLAHLLEGRTRSGIGFLAIGILVQLAVTGLLDGFSVRRWWPLILILLGASLIVDFVRGSRNG